MKYNKIEQHIKNLFEQREGLIEQIEEVEKELENELVIIFGKNVGEDQD